MVAAAFLSWVSRFFEAVFSACYFLPCFRDNPFGIFFEAVTNQILDDLVAACQPRRMRVVGDFSVRGGIKTVVTASYERQT